MECFHFITQNELNIVLTCNNFEFRRSSSSDSLLWQPVLLVAAARWNKQAPPSPPQPPGEGQDEVVRHGRPGGAGGRHNRGSQTWLSS